jgi:hypothetical protein
MEINLIIQAIQAAIVAAPQIEKAVASAKTWVTGLFESGAIDVNTQNKIHSHIDAVQAAVLAGTVPPAWQVEADPRSPTNTAPVTSSAPAGTSEAPPATEASAPPAPSQSAPATDDTVGGS